MRIGDLTPVAVTLRYPSNWQVQLPDSASRFGHWQYDRHEYVPTRTLGKVSLDSAVYYLATYQVEEQQRLNLSFQVIRPSDTLTYSLGSDSIAFWDVVAPFPEVIRSIPEATLRPFSLEFNTPYTVAWGMLIIVTLSALAIWLTPPLRRRFKRSRLQRQHTQWLDRLDRITESLTTSPEDRQAAERWLQHWKAYVEKLDGLPYTRLTTRELLSHEELRGLADSLRAFDRAIYGGKSSPQLLDGMPPLRNYAITRFEHRLERLEK